MRIKLIFILSLLSVFTTHAEESAKAKTHLLYTEWVWEMGPTLPDALETYSQDQLVLLKLCRENGGTNLIFYQTSQPSRSDDGQWFIGENHCVADEPFLTT